MSPHHPLPPWLHQAIHFAAADVVFIAAALAAITIGAAFRHATRARLLRWGISAVLALGMSGVLMLVAGHVYFLPPVQYRGPITPHVSNIFPSHHALLAAVIAALVWFASPRKTVPFAVLALLIEWALVVDRDHYVVDVAASSAIVLTANLAAWLIVARGVARWSGMVLRTPVGITSPPPMRRLSSPPDT